MRSIISLLLFSCFVSQASAKPPAPCTEEIGTVIPGQGTFVAATATRNFYLKPGQCLTSPNRKWTAVLQATDGNFVLYAIESDIVKSANWSTRTAGNPGAGLLVQQDGHFVVYQNGGIVISAEGVNGDPQKAIYQSNPSVKPYANYFLDMQDDGNLVLYIGSDPKNISGYTFSAWNQMNRSSGAPKQCPKWTCWNDPTVGQQCAFLPSRCP
ncbi:hypothetical protein ETQ85_05935 [Zoogloea oleivorans]|uniref:Bulb-type lectin domain-containing protein n=1 Tax=Zoogloea oleivorans TaxID=1552750 RepID=A0A6C2D3P6_9RHOO|nr:hypothetical protein [Zoogloea oleivorans]TYC60927.1 hypothetical protein ETQ85_05935 [Zoogloea oleivorans]